MMTARSTSTSHMTMGEMRSSNRAAPKSASPSPSLTGPKSEFPIKLYAMLQLADDIPEFSQAVTWLPHGRAFRIIDRDLFMKQVVPVFFNQTKIRSFNRQLHLWAFRRIGRGDMQVWYHKNFLRGIPEYMERLVRTKIKGNSVDSSNDGRVPDFDNLPALPTCDKEPAAVLEEMRRAILKMDRSLSSVAITPRCDSISPRPESGSPHCEHNMDPEQSFVFPPPVLPTSNDAQNIPSMRFNSPIQADTSGPMMYTNLSSLVGMSHQVDSHTQMLPVRAYADVNECNEDIDLELEPLPYWYDNDNESCLGGEFANFIEDAIQCVGN